jgi:hypothetical protein
MKLAASGLLAGVLLAAISGLIGGDPQVGILAIPAVLLLGSLLRAGIWATHYIILEDSQMRPGVSDWLHDII